jgi:hypothetical protein
MGNRTSTVRYNNLATKPDPSPQAAYPDDDSPAGPFVPTDIPGLSCKPPGMFPSFAVFPAVGTHMTVIRRLGRGAFARVFAVKHNGVSCAAKVYREGARMAQCAEVELRALRASSTCPHIVRCIASYNADEHNVLVLELGICDLYAHKRIVMGHGEQPDSLRDLGMAMYGGLAHLHSRGIIHTDIKPENIMRVRRGDRVCLVVSDLGSAMHGATQSTDHGDITSSWYRAPELYLSGQFGPSIDVWSAACVLYEHATGKPLFSHAKRPTLCGVHAELFAVHCRAMGRCALELYDRAGPSPALADDVAQARHPSGLMPHAGHSGVAIVLERVCQWADTYRPSARKLAEYAETWDDTRPTWGPSNALATSATQLACDTIAASWP